MIDMYIWLLLQIVFCSSQDTRQNVKVNKAKPLILQGGLPSDQLGSVYPNEIERMTYFDAELLDEINEKTDGNFVVSPASVKSVLGLLLHGATGKSASEIQQTLRLPENPEVAKEQIKYVQSSLRNASSYGVSMKTANAIFLTRDLQLKENYKQNAMTDYGAPVFTVDFRYPKTSVRTINNWVNESTNGLIPTIIKAGTLKPDNSLVIVNAIYFKANWLTRFEQSETSVRPFHKTANQIQYTPMMHLTSTLKHSYVPSLQAQVVQIPFQDNKHHMVIVLPKKKDGINDVTRDMKHNALLKILAQQEASEVSLQLPRFTIEFETDIVSCLQDLRTREIFSEKAHLENIAGGNKKLKVDTIMHKARIEVNEKGTYAAAVTEAGLVPLSTPQQVAFTADHPFLFYVYNSQTGIFLFEGRVSQPEEATKSQYEQSIKTDDNKNVIDRSKPNFDIRTKPVDDKPAPSNNNNSPLSTNFPNVLQSETYQPSVVVTQRSTFNPYHGHQQYQPQHNVVVQPQRNQEAVKPIQPQPAQIPTHTQQNPTGQPQTSSTASHQSHVYTQQIAPGTTQQVFHSSSSSSTSSHSSSSETKNSHSSTFTFTRYPTGVSGPYQKTNTTDQQAIRFQIDV